jgi:hypothetical protein
MPAFAAVANYVTARFGAKPSAITARRSQACGAYNKKRHSMAPYSVSTSTI